MRPRRKRLVLGIALAVLVLLVVGRALLPMAVQRYVNGVLERNGEYTGHVGDIDLALWRGGGSVEDLVIEKRNGEVPVPLVRVPYSEGSIQWMALLRHGEVVAEASVDRPELHVVAAPNAAQQQDGRGGNWRETIDALTPIRLNRLRVRDGSAHFHNFHSEPRVDVSVSDVQLVAENLTNIEDPDDPLPAHAEMRAVPMQNGSVVMRADMDPLAELPTFDADVEITKVDLRPWNSLLRAYAGIDVESGTFSAYTEIEASDGRFDGYLKPFLADLDVLRLAEEAGEQSPLATAWEAVVGATAEIFENQPTDRTATRIPISGTVENPRVDFWSTLGNVLRHAFVQAFKPGIEGSVGGS